jgi:high-affinity nickel permease
MLSDESDEVPMMFSIGFSNLVVVVVVMVVD